MKREQNPLLQKNQYTLGIDLVSHFLPAVIWPMVIEYALDFSLLSQPSRFCSSVLVSLDDSKNADNEK